MLPAVLGQVRGAFVLLSLNATAEANFSLCLLTDRFLLIPALAPVPGNQRQRSSPLPGWLQVQGFRWYQNHKLPLAQPEKDMENNLFTCKMLRWDAATL